MFKANTYNYYDQNPQNLRDFNLANSLDQEQFALFGLPVLYYKSNETTDNFDPLLRDFKTAPDFKDPIEVRAFVKIDAETTHGMTDGSGQVAERQGAIYFNISLLKNNIARDPQIGDVIEYRQENQRYQIYKLVKTEHKLGRAIRWKADVQLYQDAV